MISSLLMAWQNGAPTEEKMQKGGSPYSCDSYELTFSIKRLVYQPALIKGACNYTERSTVASGRQVHLLWKHIF